MTAPIGKRRRAIAEGYIPGQSHGPEPQMTSHETACLLNTSDQEAHVEMRAASADTLIVADGFSCREQIAQATGRSALHLAEVLRMALDRASDVSPDQVAAPATGRRPPVDRTRPEQQSLTQPAREHAHQRGTT